ncbi:MAG: hypothetical protein KIT14_17820 [bacterium]|nr:hypothetical protein [bacterium]
MSAAAAALVDVRRTGDGTVARVDPAWIAARCAGHFPGDPLVPGAYLLEVMVAAAGVTTPRVARCTFRRPVRPGGAVEVVVRRHGGDAAVELSQDGVVAARALVAGSC